MSLTDLLTTRKETLERTMPSQIMVWQKERKKIIHAFQHYIKKFHENVQLFYEQSFQQQQPRVNEFIYEQLKKRSHLPEDEYQERAIKLKILLEHYLNQQRALIRKEYH